MLNRPDYKKLVKAVKNHVDEQKSTGLVAITEGLFSMEFPRQRRDFQESWPRAMKELGLIDDATGTNTWTLPGFGLLESYGRGEL